MTFTSRFLFAALLALPTAQTAAAHEDTRIEVSATGKLNGLPPEFEPASVGVGPSPTPRVTLRLGTHQVVLPQCVASLFSWPRQTDLFITASWYHDSSTLPPYLVVHVPRAAGDAKAEVGFLLFNLKTAELLDLEEPISSTDGQVVRHRSIDLDSVCSPDEKQELVPTRTE